MSALSFEYRPVIKKIYWTLIVISILALFIIFRINIAKWSTETYLGTLFKMVMASLVPISILIRLHFFIRPYLFSKYDLKQNLLIITFKKKQKIVDLNDTVHISFTLFSPRFFGGCKIKTSHGDEVRFLSLLQNNHKIIEYLAENKPELSTVSKYRKYINTNRLVHLSWKRIFHRLKAWPYFWIKFLVFPVAFIAYLNSMVDLGHSAAFSSLERLALVVFLFVFINLCIAFFYNHFEELVLNNRAIDHSDQELEVWDFKQEKSIYLMAQIIFVISSSLVLFFLVQVFVHLFKVQ